MKNYANHLLWSCGHISSSYFFNVFLTISPVGQICKLRAVNLCFPEVFAVELSQIIPAVHCIQWSPFQGTDGTEEGHQLLSSHQLQRSLPERRKNSKHISPGTAFRAGIIAEEKHSKWRAPKKEQSQGQEVALWLLLRDEGKGRASFITQRGICTILCHPETNTVVALKTNQVQRPIFQEHSWQRGESLKKMNFLICLMPKLLGFFFLVTRLCSTGDFKLEVPNFRPIEPNLRKKVENPL